MTEELKVVNLIDDIFKEIEPSLIGYAYRYKVPNPQEEAKAWLSQAFIIADRFDKGELKKKISNKKENISEDYNPNIHTEEQFLKSFKNYLKTSFVHDIIKRYHKQKRYNKYQNAQKHIDSNITSSVNTLDGLLDAINIKDILDIIDIDINRLDGSKTSILDLVNEIFLKAIRDHCIKIAGSYGNFIVVPNIDENDNKRFFSEDFRDDLEVGVRKNICKVILAENNPMLIQKLNFLISKDKRGTLQKRLFRYFFEYHNGYPKRLRNRIKNKKIK